MTPGTVAFVGAGPGSADLITLRGARRLAEADVVLHDALTDPALRELAPDARWIDVENYHITLRFIGDVDDRFVARGIRSRKLGARHHASA